MSQCLLKSSLTFLEEKLKFSLVVLVQDYSLSW